PYPVTPTLHGWWPSQPFSEAPVAANLSVLQDTLLRYGWAHAHLGAAGRPFSPSTPAPALPSSLADAVRDVEQIGGSTSIAAPPPTEPLAPYLEFLKACGEAGIDTVTLSPPTPPWGTDPGTVHPRAL